MTALHGPDGAIGTPSVPDTLLRPSPARRAGYYVVRHAFPTGAAHSRPLRRALLRRTLKLLWTTLETTPMAGKLWIMGGVAIGYARDGRPLARDDDVDLGYSDEDHDAFVATVPLLAARGFVPTARLVSNAGALTEMQVRRDGVWIDFLRCFRRADREYWVTYLTDHRSTSAPRKVEVETEVRFQPKVPTVPPLCGTAWSRAEDLTSYLDEQYGLAWRAPERVFYARRWEHVRDSPAVVRVEPWQGEWGW